MKNQSKTRRHMIAELRDAEALDEVDDDGAGSEEDEDRDMAELCSFDTGPVSALQ